jgi:RoxA-like, cytochrome c-like
MSRDEVRTKTRDVVIVDQVLHSPVDDDLLRTQRKILWGVVIALVVFLIVSLTWRFTADRPVDYSSDLDHFKYGSIGSEPGGSLSDSVGGLLPPYQIFRVLPQLCSDKLPGGYASLGFIFEPGHDLPIGVSRRFRLGFDQVGLNCAVCHTGTVRDSPGSERRVVDGMPSHQLDLQDFFRFVLDCSLDERFTADNVLGRIEAAGGRLSWFDRLAYRYVVIPRTREQTLELAQRLALLMGDKVTEWGPGRVDTFNPYKGLQFNWQLNRLPLNELMGASDFPSLWNQKPRAGMQLHWDGNNDSVDERNLSASLGTGVTPVTIDHGRLDRVRNWIWTKAPPAYPYAIDQAKAMLGQGLYQAQCQDCHADHRFKDGQIAGARVGTVVPIEAIGTDPYRLNSYTYVFASNQYSLYPNSPYRFTHFRKTQGYANQPLDGIWARAPYLHNGAVPTLRDLMEPTDARPKQFYRGYDVFDATKVGFVSDVPQENGRRFFEFDTSRPGNSNGGHLYGTNLPPSDKDAIVEYLKTF